MGIATTFYLVGVLVFGGGHNTSTNSVNLQVSHEKMCHTLSRELVDLHGGQTSVTTVANKLTSVKLRCVAYSAEGELVFAKPISGK